MARRLAALDLARLPEASVSVAEGIEIP